MNTFTHYSVLVFLAVSVSALALQDSRKPGGVQTTPAAASKMAEKWKEFGTPGAAHKVLEDRVGTWAVEVKMFETPGAAPATSNGKSTIQSIMDGRFIQETASGVWMGQPFMGIGTMGYDNLKKKYVSSWIDSMGTALTTAEGTYDDATRTFTLTGECPDVMAGKYTHVRTLEKQIDADHWMIAKYTAGADGKEVLAGQLDYTRAK